MLAALANLRPTPIRNHALTREKTFVHNHFPQLWKLHGPARGKDRDRGTSVGSARDYSLGSTEVGNPYGGY